MAACLECGTNLPPLRTSVYHCQKCDDKFWKEDESMTNKSIELLKQHKQRKKEDLERQKAALKGIIDFLKDVAGLRIHKGTVRDFFSIDTDRVTISVDSIAKPLIFYSTWSYPNHYQITNGKGTVTEEEAIKQIMDVLLKHHVVIP
jgi:hypothetical protein